MKVTLNLEDIETEKKYPWVGMFKDEDNITIVIFDFKNSGFCLESTDEINLNDRYSCNWSESKFIPCSVTLSSL